MAFINLKQVQFSYPNSKKPVLDIAEFSVERGEAIFLFGPSGAGKTTLLEILSGVLPVDKGIVEIAGTNLADLSAMSRDEFRSRRVGYIFQNFNLIPYLNVSENITLPLKLQGRAVDGGELVNLVTTLGIADFLECSVTELSVGQQQRVAVARALLATPELILADEPTSALDYEAREKFLSLLFELCARKKITLVFVSHDKSLKHLFSRAVNFVEINRGPL